MDNTQFNLEIASVSGVLGEHAHEIEIREDASFSIVYGPNGVGKTKFLEVIHALTQVDAKMLGRLPFERATLYYSSGASLHVTRLLEPDSRVFFKRGASGNPLWFHLVTPEGSAEWEYRGNGGESWLQENTPWRPIDDVMWEDQRDGEIVPLAVLNERYSKQIEVDEPLPKLFQKFRQHAHSHLIETQRLRTEISHPTRFPAWAHNDKPHSASRVVAHAEVMRSLILDAQKTHSTITQELDRTFPSRILRGIDGKTTHDKVRDAYSEQNHFRSKLGRVVAVRLEESLELPNRELRDFELRLLALYIDDTDQKLAPFKELVKKIELFESIINSRLLGKSIRVTADKGLTVCRDTSGHEIELNELSSGEQHVIILMFDLLFKVSRGALVLIDEPEISLHVAWQIAFIPDVERIAALVGFQFIVATHSPQIINDRWAYAHALNTGM